MSDDLKSKNNMQERMVMLQYYHEAHLVGLLQIFKFFYHIFFSVLNKMKLSHKAGS
jgi:hypothetical protein